MFHVQIVSYETLKNKRRYTMNSKFLGVGLTNVIGIALFTMLVSVILKVIFTKYEVEGISQVVRTA